MYLDAEYSRLLYDGSRRDGNVMGGGVTYYYGGFFEDGVGASYRRLDAGLADSYHQARAYWFHLFLKKVSLSADLVSQFLDRERYGVGFSLSATASLGWKFTRDLELLGSLNYAKTPTYASDLRGLLRLSYNAGTTF